MARAKPAASPFPSKDEVASFIRDSAGPVGKREIARAFHIRGADRPRLKALLKELEAEGVLLREEKRRFAHSGEPPDVLVVEVTGLDVDGELLAKPVVWRAETPPPRIFLAEERRGQPAPGVGERALVRLRKLPEGDYEGRTIRILGAAPRRILGVYERGEKGGRLRPTDKRAKKELQVRSADAKGAQHGELVLAEIKQGQRHQFQREAVVLERIGKLDDQRALSLIALHEHGIPTAFPAMALAEAAAAKAAPLGKREDLRDLPLVTIDGADARDFDDAVWAGPDDDPRNPGGWHLMVAIADVAHYVRPDSPLDRSAYERGNSVYFPDRVVPMLPEELSNGWCSLMPKEERPCLAVHLYLNAKGELRRHRFLRGLMRSAARLTYEQVQAAQDGQPDDDTKPLRDPVIAPLYGAYQALITARKARGTLDLDMPERQVVFGSEGRVVAIAPRTRLDSHRLIEEFMITANVAAAETLEARRQPCMYRVHDQPDPQKVSALGEVLASFGVKLAPGQVMRPKVFARILELIAGKPFAPMVNELILRTQSQAVYQPKNLGHFGLALTRYAHFTSPIRRYADLLVHRALISGLKLGKDGLPPDAAATFEAGGQHISTTERRAQAAERDSLDRFTAAYLKDSVGRIFLGRITGVTHFGLFVRLDDSGADALVPISSLPDDYYRHDEASHSLVGDRWGRAYALGERVAGRLMEADPLTGGLVLALVEEKEQKAGPAGEAPKSGRSGTDKTGGWDPLAPAASDPDRKSQGRKSRTRRPGAGPARRGQKRARPGPGRRR